MKYRVTFLVLFLFSISIQAQDNKDKLEGKNRKFSVELSAGLMNQSFEQNSEHLTSQVATMGSFNLNYKSSKYMYFSLGYDRIGTTSFAGLSFNSYKIPLTYGIDLDWIRSLYGGIKNPYIKAIIEGGFYYRGISNFKNQSLINYNTNNVFGYQAGLGLQIQLSNSLFTTIKFQSNNDIDEALEANDSSIKLNGFALQLGLSFRL